MSSLLIDCETLMELGTALQIGPSWSSLLYNSTLGTYGEQGTLLLFSTPCYARSELSHHSSMLSFSYFDSHTNRLFSHANGGYESA